MNLTTENKIKFIIESRENHKSWRSIASELYFEEENPKKELREFMKDKLELDKLFKDFNKSQKQERYDVVAKVIFFLIILIHLIGNFLLETEFFCFLTFSLGFIMLIASLITSKILSFLKVKNRFIIKFFDKCYVYINMISLILILVSLGFVVFLKLIHMFFLEF